jgi:hypothetical protein
MQVKIATPSFPRQTATEENCEGDGKSVDCIMMDLLRFGAAFQKVCPSGDFVQNNQSCANVWRRLLS